jgi:hypothetical protein
VEGKAPKSDWSKIATDDLITIHEAFANRIEPEDGVFVIQLNRIHCFSAACWRGVRRTLFKGTAGG